MQHLHYYLPSFIVMEGMQIVSQILIYIMLLLSAELIFSQDLV